MARNSIKVSDRGYKALLANAAAASGKTVVRAGIFSGPPREDKGEGAPLTNAEIGAIHEFGIGVDERSFIRGTVDENRPEIEKRLRGIGGSAFRPTAMDREQFARGAALFGEWFVGAMKTRIRDGIDPPDRESTVKHKGSSTPLIDSGQLLSALTFDVKRGGR